MFDSKIVHMKRDNFITGYSLHYWIRCYIF